MVKVIRNLILYIIRAFWGDPQLIFSYQFTKNRDLRGHSQLKSPLQVLIGGWPPVKTLSKFLLKARAVLTGGDPQLWPTTRLFFAKKKKNLAYIFILKIKVAISTLTAPPTKVIGKMTNNMVTE
jgi:hypothetical protein